MPLPSRQTLLPFLRWLPNTSKRSLASDLLVGLSGAILALPQSIAYALIAGLPAEYGLYAAIVPVIIACLWGSSWHLICGPTAAISIVLFTSVSPLATPGSDDFIGLILLLTFLAGLFQWLLGLLRFGALVNFVSHSVVLGFTLGAAVVIALGQLPNLLGIAVPSQATALATILNIGQHLAQTDWRALAVAGFTLGVSLLIRRLWPRLPALLIGLVAGSLLVLAWPAQLGDIALVSAFEGRLPPFSPLRFELANVLELLPAAVACGMLGLVTSLSIARALASKSQQLLDANQEVRAHGRGVFRPAGGAVRPVRQPPDRPCAAARHGRRNPADLLGAGGYRRRACAAAGQPGGIRGDAIDPARHPAAGAADGDLRRGAGVAVLLPQAHLAAAHPLLAGGRPGAAADRRLDFLRGLPLPAAGYPAQPR